ncbi:two component transcriptional regulator, LuxR family [Natronincola peptidivorans]|uniref:Stage 0 sporulation protein A homolog n=1 Tax=Natronincola peptidivorans TaxID=426128 RepID=A0A1H9ZYW4_9FIRM|nr:response regulator transcription factor [Natronincola peptidivorans]SES86964.1 two component transcriptional regulator, LuxR family [Natronincola peptidivorans]
MRILIVDDHPLVRRGIASALSFEDSIEEVREAGNIEEALVLMAHTIPEITIIDLNLGREDGLEIINQAQKRNISTKFIVLTSSQKKEDFLRAREIGVDGYILKEAFPEDILYGLKVVARGKKFFDPEIMQYQMRNNEKDDLEDLSPRERDVLEELGKGLSNLAIAEKLYISEHTVKKHVSNILSKLELRHRTEAALYINNKANLQH